MFGQVADMNELNFIGEKYNISIIEDAAQSFGATYYDKKSCSISKLACTSFFPSKPLGCFGDGGAVFTNDETLHKKMACIRLHGQIKRYEHSFIGLGARMDTLQAAILNVKMDYYNDDIKNRQRVANKYTELLKNHIQTPIINPNKKSVWAQYSIQVKNRNLLQNKLSAKNIPTAIHYPKPLHLQKCFEYLGYKKGDFPISEMVSNNIISLPMNPYISDDEINYIVKELKDNYMKRFGIIGVAGYIAPKHASAIKKTGNTLLAAVDPHDNVGYLDSFSLKQHFLPNLKDLTDILIN